MQPDVFGSSFAVKDGSVAKQAEFADLAFYKSPGKPQLVTRVQVFKMWHEITLGIWL